MNDPNRPGNIDPSPDSPREPEFDRNRPQAQYDPAPAAPEM